MSLIMEDDKPVKPTDISLLSTVAEMICANYFSDMVYAEFYCNLRIIISLTFCIKKYKFAIMPILAVEYMLD